jgi:tetratricopeptide (TPR) repeat protein
LWTEAGLSREGSQRLHAALAAIGPSTRHTDQARLWFWLGFMGGQALSTETLGAYECALDLYRRSGDVFGAGLSLVRIGMELVHFGRTEQAGPILEEVRPLLERAGYPKALAQYSLALGTLKWFEGDLGGARTDFERVISICRQAGAQRVESAALSNLAELAWTAGDLDTALVRCREAIALARQTGRKAQLVGRFLTNLAGVHVERGELDLALAAAREGLPLRSEVGSAWCCMDHLALRAALAGKQINAARISGYADAAYSATAAKRQPNEARALARVRALLGEKLTATELERLLAEGAAMSEDEAVRLALEE